MHANVFIKAYAEGPGWVDRQRTERFGVFLNTVFNSRKRYAEGGLERAPDINKSEEPPHKKSWMGRERVYSVRPDLL